MTFKFWERSSSPGGAAVLLVSRVVTLFGALTLFYLAYWFYHYVDIRFVPGRSTSLLTNPQFVLSAFILTPAALILLASTARAITCWIATMLIICVATLEGCAFFYNHAAVASSSSNAAPSFVQSWVGDSIQNTDCGKIGACMLPNVHAHAVGTVGEKVLFEADYNIDELKVRRSLAQDDKRPRPIFVSLFGDSNTFGMDVSDQQTLSGQIGEIGCETHPYNLAFPGGSNSNMLAEFEEGRVSEVIKQTKGYFIYVYNDGIPLRDVGNDGMILYYGKNFPAYDFNNKGSISYMGTIWTYRVFRNALVMLAEQTNLFRALNIHLFNTQTSYHMRLTAAIIARSAELSREQFPDSKFILLFAPGVTSKTRHDLEEQLQNKDVAFLDYSSLIPSTLDGLTYPDGHPTPFVHKTMAKQIVKDLGLKTDCSE